MFVKDADSGIVINTEDAHYKAIIARRNERQQRENLDKQVDILFSELSEIKLLLQQVITGKNNG
jgi:hypothetical protein